MGRNSRRKIVLAEHSKKMNRGRWNQGTKDERELQQQTGTSERECVVEPDSPQKEVPVRDSERGTDSVGLGEWALSENSAGGNSASDSDFEAPKRRQLGESPCEMGVRAEDPVFVPDTPGMRNLGELRGSNSPFLTSAAQLEKLIASINDTSQCKSEGCEGKLRLKSVELLDMGGDATAHFTCSGGCGTRNVCLPCSEPYKDSQQSVLMQLYINVMPHPPQWGVGGGDVGI